MTALHILHVIVPQREDAIGGADLHMRDLARTQREHEGCDVSVLTPRAPQRYLDLLTAAGLDILPARDVFTVARIPIELSISLVHAHGYEASYLVAAMRTLSPSWRRLPTVMTAHGWIETTPWLRIKSALDRLASRAAHVRIASASRHAPRFPGPGVVRVIHNGVPMPTTSLEQRTADKAPGRARCQVPQDQPVVGFVGRLSPEKRPDLFLRLAHALANEDGPHFILVGGGAMRGSLVELAADLGIVDKVTFTGLIGDVDPMYEMMDILVQPSDTEGTPRSVLEAMAHSVPVVATDVGDVAELLDHGRCGMLTSPGNLEGLAAAVTSLLADPAAARKLAKSSHERYLSRYTIETMSSQIRDAYQTAVDLAASRARIRTRAQ
ncbi:MAG: glycosyltransferase family 4 protein [Sciscionella sp.]